jgi:hypothetical protein
MYHTRVQNAYKRTQLACLLGTRALVITSSSLLRQLVANSLGDARNQSAGDLIQVRCSTPSLGSAYARQVPRRTLPDLNTSTCMVRRRFRKSDPRDAVRMEDMRARVHLVQGCAAACFLKALKLFGTDHC